MNAQTKKLKEDKPKKNQLESTTKSTTLNLIIAKMAESFDSGTTEISNDSYATEQINLQSIAQQRLKNTKQQKIDSSFDSSEPNGLLKKIFYL